MTNVNNFPWRAARRASVAGRIAALLSCALLATACDGCDHRGESELDGAVGGDGGAGDGDVDGGPREDAGGDAAVDPLGYVPPACREALAQTEVTKFMDAARCLYEGDEAVQHDVDPSVFAEERIAILRGRVVDRDGEPVDGARVTVQQGAEYGYTETRAGGYYDLAVNGGGALTVRVEKAGYLPVQRRAPTRWRRFTQFPEIALIPPAVAAEPIELSGLAGPEWVEGPLAKDTSGSRQHRVLVRPETKARMVLADGSEQALDELELRVTEYTVGERGAAAMPGDLPATSGYTYAVDMSVVAAEQAGASRVIFEPALTTYVDNFLNFPVGTTVPNGYYDPERDVWEASDNGLVIKVLAVTNGEAEIDADGDGSADAAETLAAKGIDLTERQALGAKYAAGTSLWRVPIPHFSSWDHNWGFGPPLDALAAALAVLFGSNDGLGPTRCGSIIGCEQQTLGERFPIVGTPYALHYQSERMAGYESPRELGIQLSGATVPASLKRIDLEVEVLGQVTTESFGPEPNQRTTFNWDGTDAYGRAHQGRQEVTVRVGYVYDGVYSETARFSAPGGGAITGSMTRREVVLWSTATGFVGGITQIGMGLGGFSLDVHHTYDPNGSALFLGDGTTRTVESLGDTIDTVVGRGSSGFSGDGAAAKLAELDGAHGLAVAPDGTIYVSDELNHRIRRVRPDGVIDTYAGSGERETEETLRDNGPATAAALQEPLGLALAVDGTLYVAQRTGRVRAISPEGTIRTIAGGGPAGDSNGDGGPALAATFGEPHALALASDGTLFVADAEDNVIRRIGTDGRISTIAGNPQATELGDDGPATEATLASPLGIAIGPDDSLYVSEFEGHRVRRIAPSGIISTVAGTGQSGFAGDGGPALEAKLSSPHTVDVAPDGTLFITDEGNNRVRRVRTDGVIETLAGTGGSHGEGLSEVQVGDHGPARSATLAQPRVVFRHEDGTLLVADYSDGRVRRVRPALPGYTLGDSLIASADASEIYHFDARGRHLRTLDALLGNALLTFDYDEAGRLITVDDADGNRTTIARDAEGKPTSIVGPYGHSTELTVAESGMLASLQRPGGDQTRFEYAEGGMLTKLSRTRGTGVDVTSFAYDELGRLNRDAHPAGLVQTLAREATEGGHTVTRSLNGTRNEVFEVGEDAKGAKTRKHTDYAGLITTTTRDAQNIEVDGPVTDTDTVQVGDPRFGLVSAYARSEKTREGSISSTLQRSRNVTLSDSANLLSLTRLEEVTDVDGRRFTSVWETPTRTMTQSSPSGRTRTTTVDEQGRVVSEQAGSLAELTYAYDTHGRITQASWGSRVTTYSYGADGLMKSLKNPNGDVMTLEHDANGRLVASVYADGSRVALGYDEQDNPTSLTQAGGQVHVSQMGAGGLVAKFAPPSGATDLSYAHDAFLQPLTVSDGSGRVLSSTYDAASGRLTRLEHPADHVALTYSSSTGLVSKLESTEETINVTYTGTLPSVFSYSGKVSGSVQRTYDSQAFLRSESAGGSSVSFQYDSDGLLIAAGSAQIGRDADNGLIESVTLGNLVELRAHNEFGEVTSVDASHGAAALYARDDERDGLGRITKRHETVLGETHDFAFGYDARGRLVSVTRDAAPFESYAYDANGNRTRATLAGQTRSASHGAQDQLLSDGDATFAYDANGNLSERTLGEETTYYDYDLRSQLRGVTLADGNQVQYIIDPANRRVGKRVNGTLVQGFLYNQSGSLVAELGPNGSSLVARFVYGTRGHAPDYMIKGSKTYRLITDQLGSIRLVVDTADGSVAQRLDYDAFGRVLRDTNPGFQPFGFAGGLYDRDTRLVRFGARDYDAEAGRWTARDPILFGGGQANLFEYAGSDPVNRIDPTGHFWWFVGGAAAGAAVDLGIQLYGANGDWSSVDWGEVAAGALVGAVGGAWGEFAFGSAFSATSTSGALVAVTHYGPATPWVMLGGNTFRNWLMSGSPELGYKMSSGVTEYVNKAQLSWPSGIEFLKGFLGQRICKP